MGDIASNCYFCHHQNEHFPNNISSHHHMSRSKIRSGIFNYTDVLLKKWMGAELNETEAGYFESFSLVCGVGDAIAKEFFDPGNLTVSEEAIIDLLVALPDFDPVNVSSLYWLQKEYAYDKMLSGSFTSEGFCYSFNMLEFEEILLSPEEYATNRSLHNTKPRKWSLEGGYPDGAQVDTFSRRTFLSGIRGGFLLNIFTNHSHLDYLCGESLQGFKVTLHHPSELPDMDNHFRVPLDQAVYVGIRPRMITVSETLRSYKPEIRKCYFDGERHLKYFKSYTQNNCLQECIANYTVRECGCLAFYMPSKEDDESPICGSGSQECLENSKVDYLISQIDNERENSSGTVERSSCACLPSCTSLEYEVEISQTDWNWRKVFDVFNSLGVKDWIFDYEKSHILRLDVFYKEMQFLTTERNELYGYVDFFSNTGGVLGLFIGLSVTSLIKILYFLTLRLVCNIRKFGQAFGSGEPELIDGKNSLIN